MGILRELFGPSQEEVWRQLAERVGGSFSGEGFFETKAVTVEVNEWTVILDTFTVSTGKSSATYTRMRAPYVNADHFRFKVSREGLFSGIGRALGFQDVEIGDPFFDEAFVIKGNDEEKLCQLFADPQVRSNLHKVSSVSFEIRDTDGFFSLEDSGVDELYFLCSGVLKDIGELEALFKLFAATLQQLCRIGSAYKNDPNFPELAPPVDDGRGVATGKVSDALQRDGSTRASSGAPLAVPLFPTEKD